MHIGHHGRQVFGKTHGTEQWVANKQHVGDTTTRPVRLVWNFTLKVMQFQRLDDVPETHLVGVLVYDAPQNCQGVELWDVNLNVWLGSCPWDVILFNIGAWYRGNRTSLGWKLLEFTNRLRFHSPRAKLIFATTTPSPYDSPKTIPDDACLHKKKFQTAGQVMGYNTIARDMLKKKVSFSDRYFAVLNSLNSYQMSCNIHFNDLGYRTLARNDLRAIHNALDAH